MKADICIVGGGIMGLAAAREIRKLSRSKVLVLDRFGVGNDYCSSNDLNRVFRYSYGSDELYTRMAIESLKLWRELERESSQQLLIQTGLMLLQGEDANANRFNETSFQTLSRMQLGVERLCEHDLKSRFRQFNAREGIFDRNGGVLLASKALQLLKSIAQANGVRFLQGRARKIVLADRTYLSTEDYQRLEAKRFVVTVGPWSGDVVRTGMTPVRSSRQQVVYFEPRKGLDLFRPQSCPVFFTDKHYGLPAVGIDAVKVSAKELNENVDPDAANRTVDETQILECREAARKFVPDIADGNVVRTKVCMYDMTENSDFVIDHDPEFPDVVYGYGFSGHGFKFAPVIGRLLADLALDREPMFENSSFSAVPSKRRNLSGGSHLGKGK